MILVGRYTVDDTRSAGSIWRQSGRTLRYSKPCTFRRPIAGKGIANPLALLLAVGLMLKHIDQPGLVNHLRATIDLVLRKDGIRRPDLGGKASTGDFPKASFVGWASWVRRNPLRDQYLSLIHI